MKRLFLEISFPIPIPKNPLIYHFDFEEIDNPEKAVFVPVQGSRVIAPIRGRSQIGYIEKISEIPPTFETKKIIEIIDPCPVFSPQMIELGKWIAQTTLSSFGDALHAMLPAGVKGGITCWINPSNKTLEMFRNSEDLPNTLNWLAQEGKKKMSEFSRTFPKSVRNFKEWREKGLIEIEYKREQQAGPKLRKVFRVADQKAIVIEELTAKEKQVIEILLKEQEPLTLTEVLKKSGVSSSPVKNLLKKGIIQTFDQKIDRNLTEGDYYKSAPEENNNLTQSQQLVLSAIRQSYESDNKPVLIHGVTCSGKTEVYLRWVAELLAKNKGAIILVPEITLTPQMVKRLIDRFGFRVAILHSRLSDGERFDQWEGIRCGKFPVVVGARSAVFAPVPNLGTIIIDEEGEPTFKQSETPKYHAREVAEFRCRLEKAILILGSATPTLESYSMALNQKYQLVEMPERVSERFPPKVEVVDMRQELTVKNNRSMFSGALSKALNETLKAGSQAILYLNRRGHSTFVLCRACGESVNCSKCKISMVYHTGSEILRCHYCGEIQPIPKQCGKCGNTAIKFFGGGTQRVEAEARRYFPKARIDRMDSDAISAKGNLETILDKFGKREIDILIGTQMVAKGLDFPNVTLVGILAADALLKLPDFRASERNFSLLAQVAGRSGRGKNLGKVILQTYNPDHHSIKYAITENYKGFFEEENQMRKISFYPPFCHIGLFTIYNPDLNSVIAASNALTEQLKKNAHLNPELVYGPAPAPIEKIDLNFRYQIMIKHEDQNELIQGVREVLDKKKSSEIKISVNINPFISL
ncbi:MAG: primosomal protein N' [Candidatus Riflebacteria bacterium]|nr:primosomal protein N' [Candidatus Riflebacteria bacterium]